MEKFTKINFDLRSFKKCNGENINNIKEYIENYIKKSDGIRVIVGCDSQNKATYTLYAITIVLYDIIKHNGAHVLHLKLREKKERDLFTRLMNESLYSLDLANYLEDGLVNYQPNISINEYDNTIPSKRIEVHVDINPSEGRNKHNRSNIAYSAIMGMVSGFGFLVRSKPNAFAASYAADILVK